MCVSQGHSMRFVVCGAVDSHAEIGVTQVRRYHRDKRGRAQCRRRAGGMGEDDDDDATQAGGVEEEHEGASMDNDDDGYEEPPWQGSIEEPRVKTMAEFRDEFLAMCTDAESAQRRAFFGGILLEVARLENIWAVPPDMDMDAFIARVGEWSRTTFPDKSVAEMVELLRTTACRVRYAGKRSAMYTLGVSVRFNNMATILDSAATIMGAAEEACGRWMGAKEHGVRDETNPDLDVELDGTVLPTAEATQRAVEAWHVFVEQTGTNLNGRPVITQLKAKAAAVEVLEKAMCNTIAVNPNSFRLFNTTTKRLSTDSVCYEEGVIPWTRLLSKAQNPANLGIVSRSSQQMKQLLLKLDEHRLYT